MRLGKRVALFLGATLFLFYLPANGHEERPVGASPLTKNAPMPAIRMAPDFALDGVRLSGLRPGWHFLRDEPARLAPVLAAYDEWTHLLPSGELDHPARLHLIDGAGRVREIYSLAFFDEEQAFLDIAALERK